MRNKNKRFIKTDERGRIVEESLTDISLSSPWIEVTDIKTYGGHGHDIKIYDADAHEIKFKTEIEFRVGSTRFVADDSDSVCLSVRGEFLDPGHDVDITINGKHDTLSVDDDINITAASPGVINVKVNDHRYYANPNEISIIAEAEEKDG